MSVRKTRSQRIAMGVIFGLFVLYALTLLYPMIWMFLSSLKGSLEYETGNSLDLPKKWLFSNYPEALDSLVVEGTNFLGMVWNSVWMNGISIVLGTFVTAITTYTIAKLQFPGRRAFYAVILFMMMLPIYGSMASSLQIKKQLGIFDNVFNVLVSSFSVGGYKFLVLYSFFKSISWTYAEAAYIDGASHFQVFWHVMFPQALAPLAVFAIQDFIGGWNDYMTSLMYLSEMPSLGAGLYFFRSVVERQAWDPMYFAGALISAVLPVTLFIIFQDKIMEKVAFGGLKG